MAIIYFSGMQFDTDNIERIESANTPGHTNILLKNPPTGSVTVPLDRDEVVKLLAEVNHPPPVP